MFTSIVLNSKMVWISFSTKLRIFWFRLCLIIISSSIHLNVRKTFNVTFLTRNRTRVYFLFDQCILWTDKMARFKNSFLRRLYDKMKKFNVDLQAQTLLRLKYVKLTGYFII